MAGEGKVKAAAHAVSGNGGIDRGGKAFDRPHQLLTHSCEFPGLGSGQSCDFPQVGAGGEEPVISGDDERQPRVGELFDGIGQCEHTSADEAVCTVVGVQAKQVEARAFLELKEVEVLHLQSTMPSNPLCPAFVTTDATKRHEGWSSVGESGSNRQSGA